MSNNTMIVETLELLNPEAKWSVSNSGTAYDIEWLTDENRPSNEDIENKRLELQNAEPLRLLRLERNRLLQETDWRFRSDLTPSQEWIDYCQALRDLPSTASPELDENGQLINVTWPTKPE
tara:strand:- start:224 stop:586 length:363 start_codon:yes stop_codon:yes gene_type:complete